MRTHACGRRLSCAVPRIATIDDGAAKHVVHQRIRPSPGAGVVCVGFVVTGVGVAVIVRVQSAELSSVQRFLLRLIGDWGAGSERIGGIALLGCPLPRPRRRSTTVIDLLVWTPHGCTLVVLADFGSVQHGVLETPPGGRWQVGERAADLRTGSGTANPLVRARRQRTELAAIFRRHGVPEQIDLLVVLIPKTGSRITWARPPQEPGEDTIMVRIGQSADFTEYFERPPGRVVRWRAADLARAFPALGIPLSAPAPEESAAEGFEVTADDTMARLPAAADSAAGRLRRTGFPLFGGSGRRTAQPVDAVELPGSGPHGRIVHGRTGWTEHDSVVPVTGPAGARDEHADRAAASRVHPGDRGPVSDGATAPPAAPSGPPHSRVGEVASRSADAAASPVEPTWPAEEPLSYSSATDTSVAQDCAGEVPAAQAPAADVPADQSLVAQDSTDDVPEERRSRLRSAQRFSDQGPGPAPAAAADTRFGWPAGSGWTRGLRERHPRTSAEVTEDASRRSSRGASVAGADSPVSAGQSRTGGEISRPAATTGSPAEQPQSRTRGRGTLESARGAVGVRRRSTGVRKATGRWRDPGRIVRSTAGPWRPEHEQPVVGPRASGQREAGRPGEKAGGGRGARYAAAVGAAGAVLAVVAGTVFAASGFARFEVAEYGSLCRGGGGTTVAAPYSAAGTSPVHLAGALSEVTAFGPSAVWHPVDARSVQLVACVSEGQLGSLVRTCQYPPAPGHPVGRTLNLFAMGYRLSVYEARTGNRLAAIDLTGEQFAADPAVTEPDECRAATGAPEDGLPGRRHSRLSHRQVQHALAPFVTPSAAHIQAAR